MLATSFFEAGQDLWVLPPNESWHLRKRVTLGGGSAVDLCTSGVVRKMMRMHDQIVSRQQIIKLIVKTRLAVCFTRNYDIVLCQTR
jgi:hypothetical protein